MRYLINISRENVINVKYSYDKNIIEDGMAVPLANIYFRSLDL